MPEKLIRQFFRYSAWRVAPGVCKLATFALIARQLRIEDMGTLGITLIAIESADTFLFSGFRTTLARFLHEPKCRGAYAGLVLATMLVLIAGVLAGFGIPADFSFKALILWSVASLLAQAWFGVRLEIARVELHTHLYGSLQFSRSVMILLFCALWSKAHGLVGVIAAHALGTLICVLFPKPKWPQFVLSWTALRSDFRSAWLFAAPLSAQAGIFVLLKALDRPILLGLAGAAETGRYQIALDLVERSFGTMLAALATAGFPAALRELQRGNKDSCYLRLREISRLFMFLTIPLLIGLIIFRYPLAVAIAGIQGAPAASLIPILAFAAWFNAYRTHYADLAFPLAQRTGPLLKIAMISGIVSVFVNFGLTLHGGAQGTSIARLFAAVFAFSMSLFYGRKVFDLRAPRYNHV